MTACLECDKPIRDEERHFRINLRPWCEACAAPYRGGGSSALWSSLKAIVWAGGGLVLFLVLWRALPMAFSFAVAAIVAGGAMALAARALFPPRADVDVIEVLPRSRRRRR